MAVVVATRMKVGRLRHLPAFLVATVLAAWQARKSPGFVRGQLRAEPGGAYWTLTVWETGRPMVGFRDSGAHARMAPKLARWASEAVFGVWSTASTDLPGWAEVSERVAAHPNLPPLERPSPAQGDPRAMRTSTIAINLPLPAPKRARRVAVAA